jgi:hypothetical protein
MESVLFWVCRGAGTLVIGKRGKPLAEYESWVFVPSGPTQEVNIAVGICLMRAPSSKMQ